LIDCILCWLFIINCILFEIIDNWLAEKSWKQAIEVIDSRIKGIKEHLEKLQKEIASKRKSFKKKLINSTIISTNIINVYDRDLNLKSTITTSPIPWVLTGFNDKLVVGDDLDGKVYFYQNNSMIQSISTQCTARVSSVLFNEFNHMLVLCETSSRAFIYNLNSSFTGISFYTCNQPTFFNFDSKNRLVITCKNHIDIYY
jgi:hypothetical protein